MSIFIIKCHWKLEILLAILALTLCPHDALKHHITSLKTDLIFLQIRVLEGKFP